MGFDDKLLWKVYDLSMIVAEGKLLKNYKTSAIGAGFKSFIFTIFVMFC